jgi:hypothetical protein
MAAHLKNRPLRMKFFERGLPEELDAVVLRGLEKKPSNRPAASETGRALQAYRCRRAEPSTAAPSTRSASSLGRRRAVRRGALGLGSLAGILILGLAVRGRERSDYVTPDSVAPSNSPSTLASVSPADAQEPARSLEGAPDREATRPREAQIELTLRGRFIRIRNGARELSDVAIILSGAEGQRYTYRLPGNLAALESAEVALDAFWPATNAEPLRVARVIGARGGARIDRLFPLRR